MNDSPLRLRCLRLILVATLAALPATRGVAAETADLILTGARVWTAETKAPWAEAVAIRGDRIVYVGSAKGAANLRGQRTEVRELGGGLLLPGFNDSHVHLMEGAESLEKVDLIEDATLEAVQQHIKAFASENAKSPWVLGRGWFYGTFPGGLPTRAQLDAVVPDRPAYMTCYDGHSGWANSKALALAGITRGTKDPENGVIVRDPATGEPTGALKEAATDLVESKIPKPDAEARYALLLRALALLNSQGITSVQDAGSTDPAENTALYARARQYGRLSVRLSIATLMKEGDVDKPIAQAQRLRTESADHLQLRYGTIKGFVDGVIEAKTAAVLDPYPDGGRGLPNWQPEALKAAVVAADKAGLQVYLHAIGDRGVRMALDAHEAAKTNGARDRRGRIEHIETISAADYPRFAALGVIASMQPLHADPNQNLLEVWAKNAGPDRASRGFSWANLERAGARLVFGSDWPVVTSDVRRELYCAVTRKTREGTPDGGWHPEMAVSLDSALRHYTIDAAYASFEEGVKGSLAPGKLADIVVLGDDVFKAPPETILKTRVVLTMLGGKIVYRAD
jgi:predicted amidohydrolase YtcJ